ncbi:MAG: hypothetical protein GX102_12005 [Porphyromonadaceae bacterium]|nr:hypothetical protein [Porphyromonadaceae bacterium]
MEALKQFGIVPVDSDVLKSVYQSYKQPLNKLADLERKGHLIRLKRGMYVVSPAISGKKLSLELIANHLYGASYVSMETALRHYGLIPEAVYVMASMTTKSSRNFKNELGQFEYIHCPPRYFSIGINQIVRDDFAYLVATPEKALCDLIAYTPRLQPRFLKSMQKYLEEDLRLDMDEFYKMDVQIFEQCVAVGKKKSEILNLIKLLKS